MIRIERRPRAGPRILRERGGAETAAMLSEFAASSDDYRAGRKRFAFDSGIYGARSVKTTLKVMQRDKCAFCEAKISHVAHGDVEHFRPKGGIVQGEGEAALLPGYFWLAYAWDNLFLACQICNQSFKKNLFPLADPEKRATPAADADLAAEGASFVDPAREDPADHIGFRGATAEALSERGSATIKGLGLNRPEIEERRRERFALFRQLRRVLDVVPPGDELAREAQATLEEAVGANAEYAAMIRALVATSPLP